MTFAEFEQLPDLDAGKRELVDGEVITMPPPEFEHSDIGLRVLYFLADRIARMRVRPDHTGYLIGDNWLEPDVSVLWPGQPHAKYLLGSPMIAIEILSPGEDINRKVALYMEGGAAEVWVLDGRKKTMAVYAKRGDEVVWIRVEREYRSEAAGVTITLADIFAHSD
jgi:Uma2 family endonuclease